MSSGQENATVLLIGGTGKVSSRIARFLSATSTSHRYHISLSFRILAFHSTEYLWCQVRVERCHNLLQPIHRSKSPIRSLFSSLLHFSMLCLQPNSSCPWLSIRDLSISSSLEEVSCIAVTVLYITQISNHIKETSLEYTILRSTWFMENFSEMIHVRDMIRDENLILSATGDGKIPWISVDDVAEVAAMALVDGSGKFAGRELLLLGPERFSYDEVARLIGGRVGREIRHVKISEEELASGMVEGGMEKGFAAMLAELDGAVRRGEEESEGDLEGAIGRKGKTVQCYLRSIADGIW
ncbi:NAD(P)-binding protein [Gymnopus androsaceus JB14]|uniref:NAD(P)-binding protein n=1 Tax=Gymnopus androsaceus JB14 TaxID=1447944 RepID=A0A6A4IF28_9AGAR|nr:NAD(P)-binding protein [Gymnopus androsaceus JB14]